MSTAPRRALVVIDVQNEYVSGNLPNTMFVDLVYQQKDRTLLVGTYGRSIWRLKF